MKQPPPSTLIAQISPLKTEKKPLIQPVRSNERTISAEGKHEINGNHFYSVNSSDNEKVIVCSVITSSRPETAVANANATQPPPTSKLTEVEEEKQIYAKPSNYIPLRYKPQFAPQSLPTAQSVPTTGFNTAIKANQVEGGSKIQEKIPSPSR